MKIEWKSCFKLGLTCFLVFLGIYYWASIAQFGAVLITAGKSLILGCVIAYILNILMSFYERFYLQKSNKSLVVKTRRPICMVLAMLTLVAAIVLIVRLILPELAGCVKLLFKEVPIAMEELAVWLKKQEYLEEIFSEEFAASFLSIDWQQKLTQILNALMEGVGGAAQIAISAVSATISIIMELVIGLIFAIYLLVGKERLANQFDRVFRRFLPDQWEDGVYHVIRTIDGCFHRFIVGQCTEAVILGALCAAGMLILQLPYAVMIGTLIGFTALIPVAGAYIGGAVGAFMIFTVSPFEAVIFLVFLVVLQQLEGNLVYPKVVGSSIGLPGIWVLAAVTIGGAVMGIPGMLIGVPITAAAYQLLRQDVERHERKVVSEIAAEECFLAKTIDAESTNLQDKPEIPVQNPAEDIKKASQKITASQKKTKNSRRKKK